MLTHYAVLLAVFVATGCGTSSPPSAGQRQSPVETAAPSSMLGNWIATDSTGAATSLVLGNDLGGFGITVAKCGTLSGDWNAAHGGLFLADLLPTSNCPAPAWLAQARRFTVDGAHRALLDESGAVVARLRPAPSPQASMDPASRARMDAQPPQLPPGVRPAEPSDLVGRWVLPTRLPLPQQQPYVEFRTDRTLIEFDGCNDGHRGWTAGAGRLLLGVGYMRGVGCDGQIGLVGDAVAVARDGSALVLYGKDGRELRRLVRA